MPRCNNVGHYVYWESQTTPFCQVGQSASVLRALIRAMPIHDEGVSRKGPDYIGKTFQHLAIFGIKLFR